MNVEQALAQAEQLTSVSDSSRLDAELLLMHVLDKSRTWLFTWPDTELSAEQQQAYQRLLEARLSGRPVAHLIGQREFWSLPLLVNDSTLIPRPDTELLVELSLQLLPVEQAARVVDLGTGTGAIALALASECPAWQLLGIDAAEEAVALAEDNKAQLGLNNVEFLVGSWCEPLTEPDYTGPYDAIVSNPPYIDAADPHLNEGDVRFEPHSALVAANQGLADIELIADQAMAHLRSGGWLLLEHGYDQQDAVAGILTRAGYQCVACHQDLAGQPRATIGQKV